MERSFRQVHWTAKAVPVPQDRRAAWHRTFHDAALTACSLRGCCGPAGVTGTTTLGIRHSVMLTDTKGAPASHVRIRGFVCPESRTMHRCSLVRGAVQLQHIPRPGLVVQPVHVLSQQRTQPALGARVERGDTA